MRKNYLSTQAKHLKDYEKVLPEIKAKLRIPSSSRFTKTTNNNTNTKKILTNREEETIYNILETPKPNKEASINNKKLSNLNKTQSTRQAINKSFNNTKANNLSTIHTNANTNNLTNNSNTISKATDFINSVIHEYLLKKEYHKTLEMFQLEIEEKLKSKAYYLTSFSKDFSDKMLLNYFANGNKKDFFRLFNQMFPAHVRKREETIKTIEFQMHIYFTIYPISNHNNHVTNIKNTNNLAENKYNINSKLDLRNRELFLIRINEFKQYLDEIQGVFKTNELLSYFALPFIADPESNQAYKHLFEPAWVNNLKNQLAQLIKTFVPLGITPLLYEVFSIYTQTIDNSKNIVINQINNLAYDKEGDFEKMNEMYNELNQLRKKDEATKQTLYQSQIKWTKLAIEINSVAAEVLNNLKNIKTRTPNASFIDTTTLKLNKYDFFLKKNLSDFEKNMSNFTNKISSITNNEDSVLWGNNILNNNKDLSNAYNNMLKNTNNNNNLNRSNNINNITNFNPLNQSELNNNNNSHLNNYNIVNYGNNYLHHMENNSIFNESDEFNAENMTPIDQNSQNELGKSINLNQSMNNNNNINDNNKIMKENISRMQEEINDKELDYNSKFLLDMTLIKEELGKLGSINRNAKEYFERIAFIIKEIRLRLTTKRYSSVKIQTLLAILYYDIFALKSKKVKILNTLLSNDITKEEALKILNVLASSAIGREYILNKENVVEELSIIMTSEENDSVIRQNCLGILQKLSLRQPPQKKLIELDILGWCISTLITEQISVSEYSLEYCLALIMNLSLNIQGREKCSKYFSSLYKLIIHYINSNNLHIRTCINGILYSILKNKSVREEAKVKGLKILLESKLNDDNENYKKQIEYILMALEKEDNLEEDNKKVDENEYTDDWGVDFLEEAFEDDCNIDDSIRIANFAEFDLRKDINEEEEIKHLHNKSVMHFIYKFETDNIDEIKKLNEFSNSLIKKKKKLKNLSGNDTSTGNVYSKPLSRPITPMINKKESVNFNINNNSSNNSNKNQKNVIRKSHIDNINRQNKNQEKKIIIKSKSISNQNEIDEENEEKFDTNRINKKSSNNIIADKDKEEEIEDEDLNKEVLNRLEKKSKVFVKGSYSFDIEKVNEKSKEAFVTKHKIDRTPDQTAY